MKSDIYIYIYIFKDYLLIPAKGSGNFVEICRPLRFGDFCSVPSKKIRGCGKVYNAMNGTLEERIGIGTW